MIAFVAIIAFVVIIAFVLILVDVMLIDGDATVTAATEQLAYCCAPGCGVGVTPDNEGGTRGATTLNLRNEDPVALGVGRHRV